MLDKYGLLCIIFMLRKMVCYLRTISICLDGAVSPKPSMLKLVLCPWAMRPSLICSLHRGYVAHTEQ